jgi:hypothetical protein
LGSLFQLTIIGPLRYPHAWARANCLAGTARGKPLCSYADIQTILLNGLKINPDTQTGFTRIHKEYLTARKPKGEVLPSPFDSLYRW